MINKNKTRARDLRAKKEYKPSNHSGWPFF